ncbi:MAG: hypothetical protein J6B54_07125 [Clostridia bacterium]|nr:hypothetical protein [Clostridia bacterium]
MLKKVFISILLCVALALSFVACGPAENPQTDSAGTSSNSASVSSSDTNSDASTDTVTDGSTATSDNVTDTVTDEGSSDASTATEGTTTDTQDEVKKDDPYWEEDLGRKFLACDIVNFNIVLYDLDACNGDYQNLVNNKNAIVWEWKSLFDRNCKYSPGVGIDSAKLRYSPYYGKDVVIACSSNGWWGIIDYEKCTVICEGMGPNNAHSVEMLPNGDLILGVSASQIGVYYIPITLGMTEPVSGIEAPACHGVCWDPERKCLWVLEGTGVFKATIENIGTKDAKLVRDNRSKVDLMEDADCHAFSPVYGQPGKYWVSAYENLWIFDVETGKFTKSDDAYNVNEIKGVASFADGTVVEAAVNLGGNAINFFACDGFRIIEDGVATLVTFPKGGRQFYKIQPFTRNYR